MYNQFDENGNPIQNPNEGNNNQYSNPNTWYSAPNAQNPTPTNDYPYTVDFQMVNDPAHATAKTKKSNGALKVAAVLIAAAVISTACGFAGSILGRNFGSSGTGANGTTVLTQSLVNTSNTAGSDSDVAGVAAAVADSVVEITTEVVQTNQFLQQFVSEGAGSGVIISEDGYIVTNNHVIEGASKIQIRTKDGQVYEGKLIGTDADSDIAVVKVEAKGLKPVVFADSDKIVVGEEAIAVGNPLGSLGGTVTQGIVSALDREISVEGKTMHLLQTSAAINPGNSGGGLFNSSGELIGVVNAKSSASGIEGLGFAIPANTAKAIAENLMENGYVSGKVKLGVTTIKIADEQTAAQYGVPELGVYIAKVTANSDAYYGGLKGGDMIVSINGQKIAESNEVKAIVDASTVGDKLEIKVLRNNKEVDVTVELTEYNSLTNAFEE